MGGNLEAGSIKDPKAHSDRESPLYVWCVLARPRPSSHSHRAVTRTALVCVCLLLFRRGWSRIVLEKNFYFTRGKNLRLTKLRRQMPPRDTRRPVYSTAVTILAGCLGVAAIILAAGANSMSIATHLAMVVFPGGTTVERFHWAAGFEASKMYENVFQTTNIPPTDVSREAPDRQAKVTEELFPHITHTHTVTPHHITHTHTHTRTHTHAHAHTHTHASHTHKLPGPRRDSRLPPTLPPLRCRRNCSMPNLGSSKPSWSA